MPPSSFRPGARWATACAAAIAITLPAAASADTGCPTSAPYSGAGTAGDPFVIATPAHLQRLRDTSADWNDVIVLSADIDMGGCTWTRTIADTGSPAFTGTLDGQGHVMSGLTIALPPSVGSSVNAGLIGVLGAGGMVEDVGFTGNVTGLGMSSYTAVSVGGLVGKSASGSTVRRSFATGNVTAVNAGGSFMNPHETNAGGLIGDAASATSQVWASGNVSSTITSNSDTPARAGGLIGRLASPGTITAALARGSATASRNSSTSTPGALAGALIGQQVSGTTTTSFWSSTTWPSGNGAASGGPAGTGKTASELTSYATYGPVGAAWSITDGFSAATTWSICSAYNSGYPFLSQFATASACPAPPPDPVPDPTPDAPANQGSSAGTTTTPAVTPPAPAPPRQRAATTLGVAVQDRPAVPVGRRSALVDGVRTSGTVTGVAAWCEVNGTRLPGVLERRLCGIQVDRGTVASARQSADRAIRVTGRPTCSTGLVMRVRINAKAAGARRTTWSRSWRVSASPPVPCRIAPKYAVTG